MSRATWSSRSGCVAAWLSSRRLNFCAIAIANGNSSTLPGFFPGCVFLISCWYQRYEVQKRMAAFYMVRNRRRLQSFLSLSARDPLQVSMVASGVANIVACTMNTSDKLLLMARAHPGECFRACRGHVTTWRPVRDRGVEMGERYFCVCYASCSLADCSSQSPPDFHPLRELFAIGPNCLLLFSDSVITCRESLPSH